MRELDEGVQNSIWTSKLSAFVLELAIDLLDGRVDGVIFPKAGSSDFSCQFKYN
jgi:hypothetical protein